jgi:hypothetical protein
MRNLISDSQTEGSYAEKIRLLQALFPCFTQLDLSKHVFV